MQAVALQDSAARESQGWARTEDHSRAAVSAGAGETGGWYPGTSTAGAGDRLTGVGETGYRRQEALQ